MVMNRASHPIKIRINLRIRMRISLRTETRTNQKISHRTRARIGEKTATISFVQDEGSINARARCGVPVFCSL